MEILEKKGAWVTAIVEGRWVQAKVYDEPSMFGVNGCRVSKIAISKTDSHEQGKNFFEQMCYNYDRGLDFHDEELLPDTLLQKILKQLNEL
jgi:hypothetical protein